MSFRTILAIPAAPPHARREVWSVLGAVKTDCFTPSKFENACSEYAQTQNRLSVPPGMDTLGFSSRASSIAHASRWISAWSSGIQRHAVAVLPESATVVGRSGVTELSEPQRRNWFWISAPDSKKSEALRAETDGILNRFLGKRKHDCIEARLNSDKVLFSFARPLCAIYR